TDVTADLVAQHRHRVGSTSGGVVPALDGGGAKAHLEPGQRMAPGARGELNERCLQIPGRRGSGQQGDYDRKAQQGPSIALERIVVATHPSPPNSGHARVVVVARRLWDPPAAR